MKTHWRAVDVFTDAANRIIGDCKEIAADHTVKGILQSGATARRTVAAFDTRSKEGLHQVLREVANRVDHRGRRWRKEMAEVEKALNEHILLAPELLGNSFRLVGTSAGDGRNAADQLIEWSAQEQRKEFAAFRDGWTSPRSRPWRERHATPYAIILILIGAAVSQLATRLEKHLELDSQRQVLPSQPKQTK